MTVKDLIELLKTYPQDLLVAKEKFSEQHLIEPSHLSVVSLCEPRADGWVQNSRSDKESREYLLIDGN